MQRRLKYEEELTDYVNIMIGRGDDGKIDELSKLRTMPANILRESKIFYIKDMAQMIIPKYAGKLKDFGLISPTNNKPIFSNRWVMPIMSPNGLVNNMVGYSNVADERYIYGKARYYLRGDTLYGMENLGMAYEEGWAAITEGITDTIRLRSIGIKNSFAMCGTGKSDKIMTVLNRLRHGVIIIPDRDAAGELTKKYWKPLRYVLLNIHLKYKDVDEMLKEEDNLGIFNEYMGECIRYIKSREHMGFNCGKEEVTII